MKPSSCNYKTQSSLLPAVKPTPSCEGIHPGYDHYADTLNTNSLGNIGYCNGIQRRALIRNHDVPVSAKFRNFVDVDPRQQRATVVAPKPQQNNSNGLLIVLILASLMAIMFIKN